MLLGDGCCRQHRAGVGKGRTVVNHCFGCGGMGNPMGRQEGTAGGGAALGGCQQLGMERNKGLPHHGHKHPRWTISSLLTPFPNDFVGLRTHKKEQHLFASQVRIEL